MIDARAEHPVNVEGKAKFSVRQAAVIGVATALTAFGALEAWILFPVVVHQLDGPSISEAINHVRAEYIRELPGVTKFAAGVSALWGLAAGLGYNIEDPVEASLRPPTIAS